MTMKYSKDYRSYAGILKIVYNLLGPKGEVMPMEVGQTSNISSEAVKDVQGVVAAAMLKRTLNLQQAMLQELFQSLGIGSNLDIQA